MPKKTLLFLLIVLGIATFFRLWQLDKIPSGLYPDEAINGNEAISNPGKIFYPENNGREGLFINLIFLSFSIFGISIWALKIIPVIIGILTVLGLYLLTKELFNHYENCSRSVALLASFFLAISFWHTNFSRIGFRAIFLPFVLVFSFYFLFNGFRQKRIFHFIISGIFFGLGFHTYISFRFAVLILPFIFIPIGLVFWKEKQIKKFLLFTGYWLLATFIIALPIGIHFLENPQDFVGRAAPISIFAAENPIKEFGKSLTLHLGMFNFYGDSNWRHNFAGSPQLFWPLGILFLIGLILSIKELISSIKNENSLLVTRYSLLLSWFLVMLLPGILTFEGIPHSLRVIGVIPVVYIFVGLGGWKIYQFFKQNSKREKLLLITSIFFLVAVCSSQFDKYFLDWGKNPEVKGAFSKDYVEIGNYLNSLPQETQKYVIVNKLGDPLYGISIPAQTPIFIENTKFGKVRAIYLTFENLDQIKINEKKTIIIPLYNGKAFDELQKKFPLGIIKEKKGVRLYEINPARQ